MELQFLGRGAAFCPEEGNTAAFVREEDHLFLIDCGETVFERLKTKKLLNDIKKVTVAISHLHADHCGSLPTLLLYCTFVLHIRATILVPNHEAYVQQLEQFLQLGGILPTYYEIKPSSAFDGMREVTAVTYREVAHAPTMHCFGLVLDTPQGAVFYSADMLDAEPLTDFIRQQRKIAAIYTDAALASGGIHISLDLLDQVIPPILRTKTHLMHIGDRACIEKGRDMGFDTVSLYRTEKTD